MKSRREFIRNTSFASLAALTAPAVALTARNQIKINKDLINKVGLGLFSIPRLLDKNFETAIALVSKMGYSEVELFGPYSFSTEKAQQFWAAMAAQLGFKGSGLFGKSTQEVKKIIGQYNITIPSLHTDLDTLTNNMGPLADAANALGATYVVLPALPEENRKTPDDFKRSAELFNSIGAEAQKNGIRFAYHNHGYGLKKENGKMLLDIILDGTEKKLVFFEMDLFWTVAGGVDPIELFEKHSGRYVMLHVKDMKEKKTFPGDGGNMMDWMALFPNMTSAGSGVLDLAAILKSAKKNGAQHFFVEQDMVEQPEIALQKSFDFLKSL